MLHSINAIFNLYEKKDLHKTAYKQGVIIETLYVNQENAD